MGSVKLGGKGTSIRMDTPEFIAAVGSITSKPLKHRLGLFLENKISCCGLRKIKAIAT
ncbi:hypothetical protein [Microseira wollei]|uniref:hypothetical protein n=1 Tax=Microseira wollei TaxID=467598 RepID=UPI001CFCD2E6|nr:hypothetical protein [Microseira wollei]